MPSSAKPLCYAALDHIIPVGDGRKAVPDLLLDVPAKPATRDSNKVGPERSCPQHVHLELLRINTIIMGQSSHKIFRAQDMIQLYHLLWIWWIVTITTIHLGPKKSGSQCANRITPLRSPWTQTLSGLAGTQTQLRLVAAHFVVPLPSWPSWVRDDRGQYPHLMRPRRPRCCWMGSTCLDLCRKNFQ